MVNSKWISCCLLVIVSKSLATNDFFNSGFNGEGFSPFGQSSFPFHAQFPYRYGSFVSEYPFGLDVFRFQGTQFIPPQWFDGFWGQALERISNQAMCLKSMSSSMDDTKVGECVSCFSSSQTQQGFSRAFDLNNFTLCAKNYLADDYSSCIDNLSEKNSGTSASAIDVLLFRGCVDYIRWNRTVNDCQQLNSENQASFFQCMLAKNVRRQSNANLPSNEGSSIMNNPPPSPYPESETTDHKLSNESPIAEDKPSFESESTNQSESAI